MLSMRWLVSAMMAAAVSGTPAQPRSSLDVPLAAATRVNAIEDGCRWIVSLEQLARLAQVSLGFEHRPTCWVQGRLPRTVGPQTLDLGGMTLRDAINEIVRSVGGYSWKETGGAVVVRPEGAWSDPANVLNLPTAPIEAENVPTLDLLDRLLLATRPSLHTPYTFVAPRGTRVHQPRSIAFGGGTLMDALTAVVIAGGGGEWEVGYDQTRATIQIATLQMDGGMFMVPVAPPRLAEKAR